jgi:exodeoxyribonuclease VII small subunit
MNEETIALQKHKYEEALAQLETIVQKMEQNEFDIDELAAQLKAAQRLIKFCKDKLSKTEAEILKIQNEAQ